MQGIDPMQKLQTKLAGPFKDLLFGVFWFGFNFGKAEIGMSASQPISMAFLRQQS